MSWTSVIFDFLGVAEAHELPPKLMACLLDDSRRAALVSACLADCPDIDADVLSTEFEESLADRKRLKQDYTPKSICLLISRLVGSGASRVADVCAGSGSLTLAAWSKNREACYFLEEKSSAVLPLLLLNLSIRGIAAVVRHGDTLDRNAETKTYEVEAGGSIREVEDCTASDCDLVVSNPPFSLEWKPEQDERFEGFELAPRTKADFAFLLHSYSILSARGELFVILPHGVLFRGGAEEKIRKRLLELNAIDTVIGLPGNMFLNTGISTIILKLRKDKQTQDVLFVDASKECQKVGKFNVFTDEHIERIFDAVNRRVEVEKFAHVAGMKEIEQNEFNLNIPRYVDTREKEEVPDLVDAMREYMTLTLETIQAERELFGMMQQLVAGTPEGQREIDRAHALFGHKVKQHEQLEIEELLNG